MLNCNYLHIDPDHRSYSLVSRSYQRKDSHRTCPDGEECKTAARVVVHLRHTSPCRTLSSSRGQRQKALRGKELNSRLLSARLLTCAIDCTLFLRYFTLCRFPFGNDLHKRLEPGLHSWISAEVGTTRPVGPSALCCNRTTFNYRT